MDKPSTYCEAIDFMKEGDLNVHKEYHDLYYGFPIDDDNELFCRLVLEINQTARVDAARATRPLPCGSTRPRLCAKPMVSGEPRRAICCRDRGRATWTWLSSAISGSARG